MPALHFTMVFLLLFVTLHSNTSNANPSDQWLYISAVGDDYILYLSYRKEPEKKEIIDDLILSKEIIGKSNPTEKVYVDIYNLKIDLLENGLAKLRNNDAPSDMKNAQQKAISAGKGIWAKPKPISDITQNHTAPETPRESTTKEWIAQILNNVWDILLEWFVLLWKWIFGLASIGLTGLVAQYIYKKVFLERKLRLLIIGEPSSGKTAIFSRILDPDVERQKILDLAPTQALRRVYRNAFCRIGRYVIHPYLSDVPGSAFATVWDQFIKTRKQAILLVLAPSKLNVCSDGFDEKYIYTQLGYVQSYLEGGIGSKVIKKPKVIIIFLNKFDLISSLNPEDSTAANIKKKYLEIFSEHIQSADVAAKKASIPIHIIVGSALENWNCNRILDLAGRELYGNKH